MHRCREFDLCRRGSGRAPVIAGVDLDDEHLLSVNTSSNRILLGTVSQGQISPASLGGRWTPLFFLVARRRILTVFRNKDVADLRSIIEMQLDAASIEMTQHFLDAPLDRSVVRAVASDKFLDNGPQRCG
jgi:hypothetical protein